MKNICEQEKDRKLYHKLPNKFSVHRSSLLIPKIEKPIILDCEYLERIRSKKKINEICWYFVESPNNNIKIILLAFKWQL